MSDTLTGQTISKYQILEKLGRGGMAEVYKAYQENLDRYVAIKFMHAFLVSEQDFLQRFKREARAMAAMNHPNIVGVFDFDAYKEDSYYLVMEYIAGGTLKQRLEQLAQEQEGMSLNKSIQISYQVADALDYAHNRGMIHRDIKPANIMLDDNDKALLTDFGIVKMMGGQTMAYTMTGALIGTPSYMSPEQAMGEAGDKRVDIYALGVLLFQMTTGQLPYTADTPLAVIMKHVNEPAPEPATFNPNVPIGLQNIILKAMAKEPDKRYQTAGEMAQDLRAIQQGSPRDAAVLTGTTAVVPQRDAGQTPPAGSLDDTSQAVTAASATVFNLDAHINPPTFEGVPLPAQPPAATPPTEVKKKRFPWLYVSIIILTLILLGGTAVVLNQFNRNNPNGAAVNVTTTPTQTPKPKETPDTEATISAAILLTEESKPTDEPKETAATATATSTATPSRTPKPTIDPTVAFLESCTMDILLVNTYTYTNENFEAAPIGRKFPINWVLENSGTCPWPEGAVWLFDSGEEFSFDGDPIPVEPLAPGQQTTISTQFTAPSKVGNYQSTWKLVDAETDETIGAALEFTLNIYVEATSTPAPTNTPSAPPTAEATATVEQPLDLIYVVNNCEYIGSEYRCQVQITPYGGGGGPYTVFVFDNTQPAEYRGSFPIYHFAKARRCAAYNNEIVAIDDATATQISRQLYIDPNNYIPGGCVVP